MAYNKGNRQYNVASPRAYGQKRSTGYGQQQEEKYQPDKDQRSEISPLRPPEFPREREYEEEEKIKRVPIRTHALMPRTEEEPIQSLKRVSPEIIGSLFDRIKFLEQRISEIEESMQTRKNLHEQMIGEIDKDIEEKQAMIRSISDMDEQRNLKLDISVLRREKRREYVQFWRDVLELRTELRELMEEHQVESKIGALFTKLQSSKSNTPEPKQPDTKEQAQPKLPVHAPETKERDNIP